MSGSPNNSDDEFYECTEPYPTKFYAVAVPRSSPGAGCFISFAQAKSRMKSIRGSRLKAFDSFQEASEYTSSPVTEGDGPSLAMPEGEAPRFPSVKQGELMRLRKFIENNDITAIQNCISTNPMHLITGYDTPTILQLVFHFNAIHIAAKSGYADVIKLVLSHLESPKFWTRIYPNANPQTNEERRRRVLDLYLNSPETGSMSSPLHLASKFGHVECVRVLANHPITVLDLKDAAGETARQTACYRLLVSDTLRVEEKSRRRKAIVRALDEQYVVLVERATDGDAMTTKDCQPLILPQGLLCRQLHSLLSITDQLIGCPGLSQFSTHLRAESPVDSVSTTPPGTPVGKPEFPRLPSLPFSPRRAALVAPPSSPLLSSMGFGVGSPAMSPLGRSRDSPLVEPSPRDLRAFGATGQVVRVRAILGPVDSEEAKNIIAVWRRPRKAFWANLRLRDAEKGYERYGRQLAKEYNTKWTEHWDFLDDFADLSTTYGLERLNSYLSQFYTLGNVFGMPRTPPRRKSRDPSVGGVINFDDSIEMEIHNEAVLKKSPVKRIRDDEAPPQTEKKNGLVNGKKKSSDEGPMDNWSMYREENNPNKVLSDSLEDSMTSESSSTSSVSSSPDLGNAPVDKGYDDIDGSPGRQMEPVIGLLSNFLVTSPLRLVLPPACCSGTSPKIARPEKRISMFTRTDAYNSPLKRASTTVDTPARTKSTRRRPVDGVWPSLLGTGTPETAAMGLQSTYLQAAITPVEISVHVALNRHQDAEEAGGDGGKCEEVVDLANFPYVKRWKREIDLSMQRQNEQQQL